MGGAKAWDAQRDQQLFMLVVNCIKVDWKLIADEWAKKYPDDPAKPTASAISQHIYKLQKANGGGSGKPKAADVFKPSTPSSAVKRTSTVPKTPSSSAKRQKTSRNMSDEDDSEDEKADFTPVKRESTARRSKTNRQAYIEPESDDEDLDDDFGITSARSESRSVNRLDGPSSGPNFTSNGGYASPISKSNSVSHHSADPEDEVVVSASRSVGKKPMSNFDYFHRAAEDSDDGDFTLT